MKGLRSIPRILSIHAIEGYVVSCLFSNGESRQIDFQQLFREVFQIKADDPAMELLTSYEAFKEIRIIGNTLGWPNVGIHSTDLEGQPVFYPYDLDPLVLYTHSELDLERQLAIGQMIKKARKESGLSQEELAKRSGTSKHYISRIENNKSDIELLTLRKIVEAGLGKKLDIQIL